MKNKPQKEFSLHQSAITLKHKAIPHGLFVEDIIATFGHRSLSLCIIFFTIPFLQPIPLLGLSTPFGVLLALLGFLIMTGRPLKLPRRILRKHVSEKIVVSSCDILLKFLNRLEVLLRPRLEWWTTNPLSQKINGFLTVFFAILLALPLPIPLTNAFPAWFLLLNALGEVEEDGILMFVSYGIGVSTLIFFFAIGLGASEVFEIIRGKF